jgi:hypothetical protein
MIYVTCPPDFRLSMLKADHYFWTCITKNNNPMIIEINDEKTLEEINEKFSDFFPFLKIEFFPGPHHWYEASPGNKKLKPGLRIGDVRKKHEQGTLPIYSQMRTGDVEQAFRQKYDLHIQIFRLHAGEWVQTVGTDKLTLQEQNELGQKTSMQAGHEADSKTERKNLF